MDLKPGNATLLTIAQIAKKFRLPESTARFYCKRFLDYMPHVGHGKRRRYLQEALEVFEAILQEMPRSKNAAAVEEALASRFPRNVEVQTSHSQSVWNQEDGVPPARQITGLAPNFPVIGAFIQAQQQTMDRIADALTALSRRPGSDGELEAQFQESREEVQALRQEVERLKSLQAQAELVHQQDLEQLRKWLSRLAREQARKPEERAGE